MVIVEWLMQKYKCEFTANLWINFAVLTCTARAPPAVEQ